MTLGPDWRKSTLSHTSGCVEVAFDPIRHLAKVRDSKLGEQSPVLSFTWWDWAGVLNEVRRGIFDWQRLAPLEFTFAERVAFAAGVCNGEFDVPTEAAPRPLYPELGDDLKRAGEQMARHKAELKLGQEFY